MNRSRTDGYGDSWVQRQLGTGTVGYSDRRVQMRQLGTGTIGYRSWRQLGTGTIGYRGRRQLGTGTNGYKWCDKRVQRQSGTSATFGYSDNRVQENVKKKKFFAFNDPTTPPPLPFPFTLHITIEHFAHRACLNDILNFVGLVCVYELEEVEVDHERINLRPRPTRQESKHFEKIP